MELTNLQVESVKPAKSESGFCVQAVGGSTNRNEKPFSQLLNSKVDLSRESEVTAGQKADLNEVCNRNPAGSELKKRSPKKKLTNKQAEESLSDYAPAKGEKEFKAKKKASDLQTSTIEIIANTQQESVKKVRTSFLVTEKVIANAQYKTHSAPKVSAGIQLESKSRNPQHTAKVASQEHTAKVASPKHSAKVASPKHSAKVASFFLNQNELINRSNSDKTTRNRVKLELKGGGKIPLVKLGLEKAKQKISNQKTSQPNHSLAVQLPGATRPLLKNAKIVGDIAPVEPKFVGLSASVSRPNGDELRSVRSKISHLAESKLKHASPAKRANMSRVTADSNQHTTKRDILTGATKGEAKFGLADENGEFVNTYEKQPVTSKARALRQAKGAILASKEASFSKISSKGQSGGGNLVRTRTAESIAVDRSSAKTIKSKTEGTGSPTSTTTNFKQLKPVSVERFSALSNSATAATAARSRHDANNHQEQKFSRSAVTLKSIKSLTEVNNPMQTREAALPATDLLNQTVTKVQEVAVLSRSQIHKKELKEGKAGPRADKISTLVGSSRQGKAQTISTLGQSGIKAENAGTKDAFFGAEMKLVSGEKQLNGNPRQQLPSAGTFTSRHESKVHVSSAAEMVEAGRSDLNHIKDISVRTDLANRLNQMEVDLKSIQAKVVQPKAQTAATAAVYREIMSVTESFRGMSNGRWAMTIEPLDNVSIKLDLRMMDSQLVVQARLDRGNQTVLANGWSELQAQLAEKDVDLKSLTVGNQNDGRNSLTGGRDERQPGESGRDEDSWFTEELGEMMAEFEKEVQKPRMAQRTVRKSRTADATFESWA